MEVNRDTTIEELLERTYQRQLRRLPPSTVQGKSLLVSNELLRGWDFEEVLEKMDTIFHDRYTRDTDFHLKNIIGDIPDASRDDALGLLGYIAAEAYGFNL